MCDEGCICRGNWREIVKEIEPFVNGVFEDKDGTRYRLFGAVDVPNDDYYYGLFEIGTGDLYLASCVGSLKTHGFTFIVDG